MRSGATNGRAIGAVMLAFLLEIGFGHWIMIRSGCIGS
jgi:hypothetical protein